MEVVSAGYDYKFAFPMIFVQEMEIVVFYLGSSVRFFLFLNDILESLEELQPVKLNTGKI